MTAVGPEGRTASWFGGNGASERRTAGWRRRCNRAWGPMSQTNGNFNGLGSHPRVGAENLQAFATLSNQADRLVGQAGILGGEETYGPYVVGGVIGGGLTKWHKSCKPGQETPVWLKGRHGALIA